MTSQIVSIPGRAITHVRAASVGFASEIVRKTQAESSNTASGLTHEDCCSVKSSSSGYLTVSENPSIFRTDLGEAGGNPDECPGRLPVFPGSLLFVCSRTAFKEPEMDKM